MNLFDSVAKISKSSKFIVQLYCNRWSDTADCITVFRRFPVRLEIPMRSDGYVKKKVEHKINSVNHFYLPMYKIDGFIEEKRGVNT